MSKAFDEGGARGLLLANLTTGGSSGCNVVFDSTETADHSEAEQEDPNAVSTASTEGMVDVSDLTARLHFGGTSGESGDGGALDLDALQLVPQVSGLRAQFDALDREGFVAEAASALSATVPQTASKRYAAREREEREADISIHQEVLQRSCRKGLPDRSLLFQDDDDNDDVCIGGNGTETNESLPAYEPDDYGTGDDDDNDGFGTFFAADDNAARFSTESFPVDTNSSSRETSNSSWVDTARTQQTAALLDALASSSHPVFATHSDYEFLDSRAIDSLLLDRCGDVNNRNFWAGAQHWKRSKTHHAVASLSFNDKEASQSQKTPARKKKKANKKTTTASVSVLVRLDEVPDLTDIAQKPPQPKKKKTAKGARGKTSSAVPYQDPLQWSQAVVTKHAQTDHLLPVDAGLGVQNLFKLFLLPNAVLSRSQVPDVDQVHPDKVAKSVGFALNDDGGGHIAADGDFDDDHDNDGPGFCFAGDDDDDPSDFVVPKMDDVRKVERVQVSYATVAKRVDVKRLKSDLWNELQSKLVPPPQHQPKAKEGDGGVAREEGEGDAENEAASFDDEDDVSTATTTGGVGAGVMSFQDAVAEMEASKTQADVTLPFYFICVLHLANERSLSLRSNGLHDFDIRVDASTARSTGGGRSP